MRGTKLNFIFLFGTTLWLLICFPSQARQIIPDDPLVISRAELHKANSIVLKKHLRHVALDTLKIPIEWKETSYTLKRVKFTNRLEDDCLVIGKLDSGGRNSTKVVLVLKREDGVYKEVFRWLGWNKGFNAKVELLSLSEIDGVTGIAITWDWSGGQSDDTQIEVFAYVEGKFRSVWRATIEEVSPGCYTEYENHYQLVDRGAAFKDIDLHIQRT